jgi:hypothetical protein
MSDLKLESDGATRRYDMRGPVGALNTSDGELIFLAHLGEFDLHWDEDNDCYTVVKERPLGGRSLYNFTDYHIIGDALVANDADVALDPYHMCLLYQAHEHFGYQPKEE